MGAMAKAVSVAQPAGRRLVDFVADDANADDDGMPRREVLIVGEKKPNVGKLIGDVAGEALISGAVKS
jgi:hypothetical protein